MNKTLAALTAATVSAATGFLIHVGTQPLIEGWVQQHMEGRTVTASWDVRYLALATSLETGIALAILYGLIRAHLPSPSSLVRGLLMGLLLLAVMGRLFRQPLMNLVIGNPLSVVAVQDGINWVVWLAMCMVLAVLYDALVPAARR